MRAREVSKSSYLVKVDGVLSVSRVVSRPEFDAAFFSPGEKGVAGWVPGDVPHSRVLTLLEQM